jgi:hypothetical protein
MKADRNDLQALQQAYQLIKESHDAPQADESGDMLGKLDDLQAVVNHTLAFVKKHYDQSPSKDFDTDDVAVGQHLVHRQQYALGHKVFDDLSKASIEELFAQAVEEANATLTGEELSERLDLIETIKTHIGQDLDELASYNVDRE